MWSFSIFIIFLLICNTKPLGKFIPKYLSYVLRRQNCLIQRIFTNTFIEKEMNRFVLKFELLFLEMKIFKIKIFKRSENFRDQTKSIWFSLFFTIYRYINVLFHKDLTEIKTQSIYRYKEENLYIIYSLCIQSSR